MLNQTFSHLDGVSERMEAALWRRGILAWDDLPGDDARLFGPRRDASLRRQVAESRTALASAQWAFFLERLRPLHRARALPHIRGQVAYVDIETTGLAPPAVVTTIALYDGTDVRSYVRDRNLPDFVRDIAAYRVIVTYNGARFDLPFLEREFGRRFGQAHLDLYPVLRALGLRGGLKGCERAMGLRRQVPEELNGFFAVLLWQRYRQRRDEKALQMLLAYNAQDVLSLEVLLTEAYNRSMAAHPAATPLACPSQPVLGELPPLADVLPSFFDNRIYPSYCGP